MIASTKMTLRRAFDACHVPHFSGKSRTLQKVRHELNRWERLTDDPDIRDINQEIMSAFRESCLADNLSPDTIATQFGTVITILRSAYLAGQLDSLPDIRKPKRSTPDPDVPPFSDLGRLYARADCARWPILKGCTTGTFWRSWIACSYFTGLRLDDQMHHLRWDQMKDDHIAFQADKTEKVHKIPLHPVLRRHLEMVRNTRPCKKEHDGRVYQVSKSPYLVRRELKRISLQARIGVITPQMIRRLAAEEYDVAHPGAGDIIQGSGIKGSVRYYRRSMRALQIAQSKLAIPPEMLSDSEKEDAAARSDELLRVCQRLDDRDFLALKTMAESLASR